MKLFFHLSVTHKHKQNGSSLCVVKMLISGSFGISAVCLVFCLDLGEKADYPAKPSAH